MRRQRNRQYSETGTAEYQRQRALKLRMAEAETKRRSAGGRQADRTRRANQRAAEERRLQLLQLNEQREAEERQLQLNAQQIQLNQQDIKLNEQEIKKTVVKTHGQAWAVQREAWAVHGEAWAVHGKVAARMGNAESPSSSSSSSEEYEFYDGYDEDDENKYDENKYEEYDDDESVSLQEDCKMPATFDSTAATTNKHHPAAASSARRRSSISQKSSKSTSGISTGAIIKKASDNVAISTAAAKQAISLDNCDYEGGEYPFACHDDDDDKHYDYDECYDYDEKDSMPLLAPKTTPPAATSLTGRRSSFNQKSTKSSLGTSTAVVALATSSPAITKKAAGSFRSSTPAAKKSPPPSARRRASTSGVSTGAGAAPKKAAHQSVVSKQEGARVKSDSKTPRSNNKKRPPEDVENDLDATLGKKKKKKKNGLTVSVAVAASAPLSESVKQSMLAAIPKKKKAEQLLPSPPLAASPSPFRHHMASPDQLRFRYDLTNSFLYNPEKLVGQYFGNYMLPPVDQILCDEHMLAQFKLRAGGSGHMSVDRSRALAMMEKGVIVHNTGEDRRCELKVTVGEANGVEHLFPFLVHPGNPPTLEVVTYMARSPFHCSLDGEDQHRRSMILSDIKWFSRTLGVRFEHTPCYLASAIDELDYWKLHVPGKKDQILGKLHRMIPREKEIHLLADVDFVSEMGEPEAWIKAVSDLIKAEAGSGITIKDLLGAVHGTVDWVFRQEN